MKFLSMSLLSCACALLATSALTAQGSPQPHPEIAVPQAPQNHVQTETGVPQKARCSCANCQCTPEHHCGCYSVQGCPCSKHQN